MIPMRIRISLLAISSCLTLLSGQASAQYGLAGGAGYNVGQPPMVNQALNLARTGNNFNDPALNYFLNAQPINNLNRMQTGLGNALMYDMAANEMRPGAGGGDPEIDPLSGKIRPIRRPAGFGNMQGSFGTVRVNARPPYGSFAPFQNNPQMFFPVPR